MFLFHPFGNFGGTPENHFLPVFGSEVGTPQRDQRLKESLGEDALFGFQIWGLSFLICKVGL